MLEERVIAESQTVINRIIENIEKVIIGKHEVVKLVTLCFIAKGHVLIEDVPGTGKTTLVSTLAKSVDCGFRRIQFTPDVMPSDVTGFSIFNQKTEEFEFRPGGVMSNIILADEINRASAKTQSALLEAMEERQVTVDSKTYKLEEPFMVLATQNPVEQYGTYPLPEAQVDRFLVKTSVGYPDFGQEVEVVLNDMASKKEVSPVVSKKDILTLREITEQVVVSKPVVQYCVQIVESTRDNPEIQLGSSSRGALALARLARAYALADGRGFVLPDDIKRLVNHTLAHRISITHEAKNNGRTAQDILNSIVSNIAVPLFDKERFETDKASK